MAGASKFEINHLSKCSAFLAEVDHDPDATALSALDGLLDSEDEVRAARANVGSEDVRAIALVVYAKSELLGRVADVRDRAELKKARSLASALDKE